MIDRLLECIVERLRIRSERRMNARLDTLYVQAAVVAAGLRQRAEAAERRAEAAEGILASKYDLEFYA